VHALLEEEAKRWWQRRLSMMLPERRTPQR
jgi:hypothetical protein